MNDFRFIFLIVLAFASGLHAQNFVLGADVSNETEMESKGQWLYDSNGVKTECTALMKQYGINAIRLRVWVNPAAHGNWCNKEDVLQKALRAKAIGMDVMVDFHYSDWWCDPAKQPIPKAWENMNYNEMRKALAEHTVEVLTYLKENGITPRWVQIGNETSNGMLWSVETGEDGWEKKDENGNTTITRSMGHARRNPKQYAGFIRAGYDAVKSVLPEVICIVHLDNGFDQELYDWNLGLLKKYGAKWDMVGMSLYPYWTLMGKRRNTADEVITDCIKNIKHVHEKFGSDCMIVETGFEVDPEHPEIMEEGYRELKRVINEARDSTDGHCRGVFYWEPESRPEGYRLVAFDMNGRPTRIMEAFRETKDAENTLPLVPYPNSIKVSGKAFMPTGMTQIIADENLKSEAVYLSENIGKNYGKITLKVAPTMTGKDEHYTLNVSQDGISINGKTTEAVFDGIQTLLQLLEPLETKRSGLNLQKPSETLETLSIDDEPAFGYRTLLLDPARHFFPVADVKRYIDEMAHYKFNHLQMHLVDDQGWRIEIKSHPELTKGIPHYSQDEIKDLISYAATRHIELVPEIDIPGHTFGMLKSHRELLCDCVDTTEWGKTLRTDVMLCASKPAVYALVSDILKEVCQLFPSQYIHLGGDESVIDRNWGKCKACQVLKKEKGIDSNNHIMGYFFSHFFPQLREAGKHPILWCEMDNIYYPAHEYLFDYPKDVTLVTWRNALTPKAIELTTKHGNNLIMAPGEHCYFDYPQGANDLPEFNNWGMPTLTLEQAYNWDNLDPQKLSETPNIVGVMGTLWAEAIPDINRAFYMTYPRALALSETGWTQHYNRDWKSFTKRIPTILNGMMQRGVTYRVPWECYR